MYGKSGERLCYEMPRQAVKRLLMPSEEASHLLSLTFSLFRQASCVRRIDFYTRTHGGADRHALYIRAFACLWFEPDNRIEELTEIFKKLLFPKADLSDGHMKVSCLVNPEFYAAGLHLLNRFSYIESLCTDFRVGHKAPRTENFA